MVWALVIKNSSRNLLNSVVELLLRRVSLFGDPMMSIEEEVKRLIEFLSHPAGFNVGMGGVLGIRPINEGSPPTNWAGVS